MDLNTIWFVVLMFLFIGYFLLEGFDYGVGVLLPFLGKDDADRRVIINTIGPFWDANEVWLVTAGASMFAAFPHWYATLFSGFHIALLILLVSLIFRGVAFEFRSKDRHPRWRGLWDWSIFAGGLVPALLWGVAFANIVRGVPIGPDMQYQGGFWNLLNPYALSGGLAFLALFTLHGAVFLNLRTKGEVLERAQRAAERLWLPTVVLVAIFVVGGYIDTDMFSRLGLNPGPVPLGAGAALLAVGWFIRERNHGWAFAMTSLSIILAATGVAMGLYPRVMVSSLNNDWSLTIYNAASSPYTLRIMSIVALIILPVVLLYEGYSYWVFRKRIGREDVLEY